MRQKKIFSDPILASIDALSHDGRGIATINGKKTFIFGALPKEQVRFKLTTSKKDYNEGEIIDLIGEASPLRVAAPCAHFGQCGGCNLQHLEETAALQHKQQVVLDNMKHIGQVVPETILPPITGDTNGYRRKARLGVRYVFKKESLLIGFRERTSNRIAIMDSCKTLDPRVGELISPLKKLIQALDAFESIAQIEVAIASEVALVIRHLKPLSAKDEAAFINFAKQYSDINLAIYLQAKGPDTVRKLYPANQQLLLEYSLDIQDIQLNEFNAESNAESSTRKIRFQFHPLDFVQVNEQINQKMVNQALKLLNCQNTDNVLDLFCGLGNFTLAVAQKAAHVVGVEGALESILRAKGNAQLNNIINTEFYVKDLTKPLEALDEIWAARAYDKMILDPPRTGAKEIVEVSERWPVKSLLYVSCNPATLARDAGILVHQKGYQLKALGIIDMFPHTAHIETMALFIKE